MGMSSKGPDATRPIKNTITRRSVLGSGAAAAVIAPSVSLAASGDPMLAPDPASSPPPTVSVVLKINGTERHLTLDPRTTLLDALREHVHLTGTKKGCDHGQCGACTVMVEGRRINSCLTLAAMHDGDSVTTIEGLGAPGHLHPMQAAFITHDGFQCGYCTPGQIMSSVAVLEEIKAGIPSHVTVDLDKVTLSDAEVRERMSGNLCRCAAYSNIIAAIRDVSGAA
jgi:xanthine dehydrogenase YagT iron-sulfur-binding subunit